MYCNIDPYPSDSLLTSFKLIGKASFTISPVFL